MLDPCQAVRDALPELARPSSDGQLLSSLAGHAASCDACGRAVAGARALGQQLGAWTTHSPADDLVARTLARVRLAEAMAPREPSQRLTLMAGGTPPPPPASLPGVPGTLDRAHRRRSSVELLATWALPGPRPSVAELPRQKLGLRLTIQAAAAIVLVALCTGFGVAFSPAIVEAWEGRGDRHQQGCQKHLEHLGQALRRYRADHPAADQDPSGPYALRDALVKGGYARDEDFLCPATRSPLGAVSYYLRLPEPGAPPRAPLASDHFSNHRDSINVVRPDGKVEHIDEDQLRKRLSTGE